MVLFVDTLERVLLKCHIIKQERTGVKRRYIQNTSRYIMVKLFSPIYTIFIYIVPVEFRLRITIIKYRHTDSYDVTFRFQLISFLVFLFTNYVIDTSPTCLYNTNTNYLRHPSQILK